MSEIKDGGPAFPTSHEDPAEYDGHNRSIKTVVDQGMTLRDYFAAKVLSGYMATDWPQEGLKVAISIEDNDLAIANHCYAIADAMLKARQS